MDARCYADTGECNQLYAKKRDNFPRSLPKGRYSNKRPSDTRITRGAAPKKTFCRICYHAGVPPAVFNSHPISSCKYLTSADRADLGGLLAVETLSLRDQEPRTNTYSAPGWDEEDSDSDNIDDVAAHEINLESYPYSIHVNACKAALPSLSCQLNLIKPIPSQIIITSYYGQELPITLDSGATISFLREDWAIRLKLPISPNKQLATLADEQTMIEAIGEVDIQVTLKQCWLRLRALVVKKLQARCFGGTNST